MEEDNNSSVYIPQEVVSNILVRLPAIVLYDVMMYVCRTWYNIISSPGFVKSHLDHTTNDLVLLYRDKSDSFESVKISKDLSLNSIDLTSNHIVSDSFDGIVLIENSKLRDRGRHPFYIVNLVTRQCITYSCWPSFSDAVVGLKLGRSISGVYKLIYCYYRQPENPPAISVLTLGTGKDDDWRSICLGDESLSTFHAFDHSLTVGGCFYIVMHCITIVCQKDDHFPGIVILEVDLETEMVRQIPAPPSRKASCVNVSITGVCFSVLDYTDDKHEFCVWRLGSASSGDWGMVCKYKVERLDQFAYGPNLKVLGWVVDGEVLAVCCLSLGVVFTYNVKTGNTTSMFKRECSAHIYGFYHAKTLVRL